MGTLAKTFLDEDASSFTMNTATVSIWFRVPTEAIDAARGRDAGPGIPGKTYSTLRSAVPLLMWGAQLEADSVNAEGPIGPSYIAVGGDMDLDIYPQPGGGSTPIALIVSLQTDTLYSSGWFQTNGYASVFGNERGPSPVAGWPPLTLDVWHHLFLSWSLASSETVVASDGDGGSVTGFSTMYCAIDNVEKSGDRLPASWDERFGGANRILSQCGYAQYRGVAANGTGTLSIPKLSINPLAIPGYEVGASREGSNRANLLVQCGPMHIFGGLMLPSSAKNLFIGSNNRPTNPSTPQNSLGVTPHVRFDNIEDWQAGNNRGSLGNFTRVGTINPFSPGP